VNRTQSLTDRFDLQFALCPAVKIEGELQIPVSPIYISVTGLWGLSAGGLNDKLRSGTFNQQLLRYFYQFV
jgi:hypothetical protein